MPPPADLPLLAAAAALPPGRYALALSGGPDSTALLLACCQNPHLHLHLVHLNHQTRGPDSDADADFVRDLALRFNLPHTIARRSDLESAHPNLSKNPSARYRAIRLGLFRQAVEKHHLAAVLLAHHADDQAETVLFRLLRGSSLPGLTGMSPDTQIQNLRLLRPLLNIRKQDLKSFLQSIPHPWREDASNASPRYARNRVRQLLACHPSLTDDLLALAQSARAFQNWLTAAAPRFPDALPIDQLNRLPAILARHAARTWLTRQGLPPQKSTPQTLDRLLLMASDAATPARQHFPGPLVLTRRHRQITAQR